MQLSCRTRVCAASAPFVPTSSRSLVTSLVKSLSSKERVTGRDHNARVTWQNVITCEAKLYEKKDRREVTIKI
jgi:hypothetical protein